MTAATKGTIAFATASQAAIYSEELVGQLSDGAWENTAPQDHWEAWAQAAVVVSGNGNVGRDFDVRKDGYAFAKQLIPVIGERMVDIGRRFDPAYSEKKLRADLAAISAAMKTRTAFTEADVAAQDEIHEEPIAAPVVAAAPSTQCRGKWSACGGANPSKSESWHLCVECTAKRTAAAQKTTAALASQATELAEIDLGPVVEADGTPTATTLELLAPMTSIALGNTPGQKRAAAYLAKDRAAVAAWAAAEKAAREA